jgi:ketosteroid isomerase-like protein
MSAEDDVRAASKQFYAALNRMLNGDAGGIAETWSHSATATTMHPIGGREAGWSSVGPSFEQFAKLAKGGQVELKDQLIQVASDMAYEVGVEKGQVRLGGETVPIDHRVTNVYRGEAGGWKMVHHHADVSPALVDLLRRLPAEK